MELVDIVDRFYTPPLCLFGAIGNCLSVYVFCMTSGHRSLSSSYYLSALAISDIGFLINLFAVWLTGEGYEIITTRLTCPLIMYLGQVTCFLSVWFIVAFTCERFCAVCYPLTRPAVCTVARAKKVIVFITVVALVAFSYVWVIAAVIPVTMEFDDAEGYGPPDNGGVAENELTRGEGAELGNRTRTNRSYTQFVCSVPEEFHEFSMMANHLDSFFTLILPFCAITFLNFRITLCVWQLKGQRKTIVALAHLNRSSSTASTNDRTRILISPNLRNGHGHSSENGNSKVGGYSSYKIPSENHRQEPGTTSSSSPTSKTGGVPSSSSAAEVRVTKTLLLVSTVFLVLNLPSHAIRTFAFFERGLMGRNPEEPSYVPLLQQWANILFNTNFSVNFLLYCVSGRNFRKSLRNLCCNDDRNGRMGHKTRRMIPKPRATALSHRNHHRHQAQECSSGSVKLSHRRQNEEDIDLANETMDIVRRHELSQGSKNSNLLDGGNCHLQQSPTRTNNRETSFYPSAVTEVETHYA